MTSEEYIFGDWRRMLLWAGLFILLFILYHLTRNLFRRKGWEVPLLSLPHIESPAIWSKGTAEKKILMLEMGTFKKRRYILYSAFSLDSGAYIVLELFLAKPSPLHVLCVNAKDSTVTNLWKNAVMKKHMESVTLEGDFPNYFNTYVSKQRQVEIRELFDPATMAYFVDFCQNFDFEILDDSLFVAVHQAPTEYDTTPATTDAHKLALLVEKQIEGWAHLNPDFVSRPGYDPMKHFKGDKSRLKTTSYIHKSNK